MSGSSEECNEYRGWSQRENQKLGFDLEMAGCGVFTGTVLMHPLFYIDAILKVKPKI